GTSKRVAEILALIIGNAKVYDISDAPEDIHLYNSVISVFAFHGYKTANKTKKYLHDLGELLNEKSLGLVGVGLSHTDMNIYEKVIEEDINRKADFTNFIEGELRINKLTDEDRQTLEKFLGEHNMKLMDMGMFKVEEACENACEIKKFLDSSSRKLDKIQLQKVIDEYVSGKNTCTLTSGVCEFIRSTPIEYLYVNNCFYFFTEGGLKFKGILQNPNVSICIYDDYTGMGELKGLQISGEAELISTDSSEYEEIINAKKLNLENINKLPVTLNLLKVYPLKFEFLNSNFKDMEVDVKQVLEKVR
ncbi:MAG: pyridoxamine 5'-phosphate oxidase family protein, partial [Clostridium sp.]|nr:pyridoxamine 5'-phosphate oxidase family protein [Clostridium sp.]